MPEIILASSSPRRRELLAQAGLEFSVVAPDCHETLPDAGNPEAGAIALALEKALAVARRYPEAVVIGADTIGVIEGEVIGKPADPQAAREMLRRISGRCHTVVSGVAVIGPEKKVTRCVSTDVYIKTLSEAEIDAYVATGEPLDKAGAYAIQGRGGALVTHIEGDFQNVVGLPLQALGEMLLEFGVCLRT